MNEQKTSLFPLEVSSALLVPAAAFSFIRVMGDITDVLTIMVICLVSSLLALLARRVGAPLVLSFLASVVGLIGLLVVRFSPESAIGGIIPTKDSAIVLGAMVSDLVAQFQTTSPPDNFEAILMGGITIGWLMAFCTDWGAVRLKLAFETAIPSMVLFVFATIPPLNTHHHGVAAAIIYGGALSAWGITQRHYRMRSQSILVTKKEGSGIRPLLAAGLGLSLLAVTLGGFYGNRLPFADSEPRVKLTAQRKERTVTNPYIDLKQRLVEQTDSTLFEVTANRRAYWRMVGLDTYTNRTSSGQPVSIWEVRIGGNNNKSTKFTQPGRIPGSQVKQSFKIYSLDVSRAGTSGENVWIPTALSPTSITDDGGAKLRIDDLTQSITIGGGASSNDFEYSLESVLPSYSSQQLGEASKTLSTEPVNSDLYLQLPDGLSPVVTQTAMSVAGSSNNRYHQALALQNYFQQFDYSLDLPPIPAGTDAMEHFLATRIGFCQQFAGTYAVMARSLGIPARVAVGFTWGDPIDSASLSGSETTYRVTGRQAHAWPEIYFGQELGWVAFEPTPGRGNPASESYTGVPSGQDSDGDTSDDQDQEPEPEPQPEPIPTPEETPNEENEFQNTLTKLNSLTYGKPPQLIERLLPVSPKSLLSSSLALALLLLWPIGLPMAYFYRRRNQLRSAERRATSPNRFERAIGVRQLWNGVASLLSHYLGLGRKDSETITEYAARVNSSGLVSPVALSRLSELATEATYDSAGVSESDSAEATQLARNLRDLVHAKTSRRHRWKRCVSPSLIKSEFSKL